MKRRWTIWLALGAWLLALLAISTPQATSAAVDFSYNTAVTYHVNEDGTTSVTENYTVTNNTALQYLSGIKITTPTTTLSDLHVAYSDGGQIPASAKPQTSTQGELHYTVQEIDVTFPRQTYGAGRTWSFAVTYSATGLVDTKGSSHTIYVPAIDPGDAGDSYAATVDVPADFGNPHFAGAASASGGVSGGRQTYSFTKDQLTVHSLALAFGDSTIYDVNFNFPLTNDSASSETLTVTLPPDLNNQKSYINSLSPTPADTRLDSDGNVLADYHLAAHQHQTVSTNVSGQVNYLQYDLAASKKKSAIPADLVNQYTQSTNYWPTTGPVAAAAKKITDPNAPVIKNVQAIYNFVVNTLSYNPAKVKFNIRQGAARALANPTNAVCLEYADLTIAMLRSQGIPAREAIGYAYSGSLKNSPAVDDSLHAWVEVYVPGIGWMTLDPTWGEKFDEFGQSDLDHFAFAVWGSADSSPTAVMAGGNDQGYQYENATLAYESKVTVAPSTGSVSGQRFAILPFLAWDKYNIIAQAQVASDHNQLAVGGGLTPLGSLAPSQHLVVNRLVWGSTWDKAVPLVFSQTADGTIVVLASAKLKLNLVGLVAGSVVLVVVIAVGLMLKLGFRKSRTIPPSRAIT